MSGFDDIINILRRLRRYANYFEWPDKQRKELGVVEDLLKAMALRGETRFRLPKKGPSPNHAPDCVAVDLTGSLVAVEVCELVSEKAIRCNIRAKSHLDSVYCDWLPDQVAEELGKLLTRKDAVNYMGGPYSKIVVIIHSDEPVVLHSTCAGALGSRVYRSPNLINEAYFVFSYDPGFEYCPYVRVNFGESN